MLQTPATCLTIWRDDADFELHHTLQSKDIRFAGVTQSDKKSHNKFINEFNKIVDTYDQITNVKYYDITDLYVITKNSDTIQNFLCSMLFLHLNISTQLFHFDQFHTVLDNFDK